MDTGDAAQARLGTGSRVVSQYPRRSWCAAVRPAQKLRNQALTTVPTSPKPQPSRILPVTDGQKRKARASAGALSAKRWLCSGM